MKKTTQAQNIHPEIRENPFMGEPALVFGDHIVQSEYTAESPYGEPAEWIAQCRRWAELNGFEVIE